jgi:hypothetical protein
VDSAGAAKPLTKGATNMFKLQGFTTAGPLVLLSRQALYCSVWHRNAEGFAQVNASNHIGGRIPLSVRERSTDLFHKLKLRGRRVFQILPA